jgi:hypothetical protein
MKAAEKNSSEALLKVTEKTASDSTLENKRATDWIEREKNLLDQVQRSAVLCIIKCCGLTAIQLSLSPPVNFIIPIPFIPRNGSLTLSCHLSDLSYQYQMT